MLTALLVLNLYLLVGLFFSGVAFIGMADETRDTIDNVLDEAEITNEEQREFVHTVSPAALAFGWPIGIVALFIR